MKKFSKDEVYEKLENVLYDYFSKDLDKVENYLVERGEGDMYYEMLDNLCDRLVNEFELDYSFEIVY